MGIKKLKLNEQKRQHRRVSSERSQPANRSKLGLLEKHKDYVQRARDFHSKEDRIQRLREKASLRNKDEFYFGMIKSGTKKGVHVQSRGNEPLPTDLVTALKTQDATYIRMQATMEQGRVQRLKEQLAALVDTALPSSDKGKASAENGDGEMDDYNLYNDELVASTSAAGVKRNHVIFTDSLDAVRSGTVNTLLQKRTTPTALPATPTPSNPSSSAKRRRSKPKPPSAATDPEDDLATLSSTLLASATAHRTRLESELAQREARLVQLKRAARELELQRSLMGKGAKEVVRAKGDRKAGEEEWWLQGVKGARKGKGGASAEQEEGKLPMAEEGVATGARVWKWKAQRKR
ncbi:U3 small nucleolar RNA-associated protein 11 [Rhodotorula toruloides]|uniref:U3 small nucleolar RNA-associated protein 11 n=1 Tax=Rhodotorula toruloides TaxID=5286 RepID=A0A511KDE3_RHOTO|nr:U3 small nucleolar RNA-associated protein 11 [Rhodotorula toruloides]